jgi:hypothetical protein
VPNADRVFRKTNFITAAGDSIDMPTFNSASFVGGEKEREPWSVHRDQAFDSTREPPSARHALGAIAGDAFRRHGTFRRVMQEVTQDSPTELIVGSSVADELVPQFVYAVRWHGNRLTASIYTYLEPLP